MPEIINPDLKRQAQIEECAKALKDLLDSEGHYSGGESKVGNQEAIQRQQHLAETKFVQGMSLEDLLQALVAKGANEQAAREVISRVSGVRIETIKNLRANSAAA